jgi:hypothetical protein
LPTASADTPKYLDLIITLCRQEDPRERPAAWELVHMFPDDKKILEQIDLLNSNRSITFGEHDSINTNAKLTRLEVVRDL